jgi:hypothetical protein
MPKQIAGDELDLIVNIVTQFPDGVALNDIFRELNTDISLRQMQKRLTILINHGRLISEGATRAKKYKIPQIKEDEVKNSSPIPLSAVANEIQRKITSPIYARKSVGYNRKFLEDYRPNESRYLPDHIIYKLFEIGKMIGDRPVGTYAREIYNRILIDLSWNSSRLEGNSYSLLETERLLKLNATVAGKDIAEARMILNHKEAIEFLVDSIDTIEINRFTIVSLHAILSHDLLGNPKSSGRLREIPIGIGRSVYQPISIPQVIEECFQQIIDKAFAIRNPFEQAFFLMVHLPYLQPFEDVNKRVSRLAANIPLLLNHLCPLSFVDVPKQSYVNGLLGIYELNRIELMREVFVWAYERSCLRYSNTKREVASPDPLRIRYRALINEIVPRIVLEKMDKTKAISTIREYALNYVPLEDQVRFIETVEIDIMSLHEGNIARHRLRPSDYNNWQEVWR